MFQRWIDDFKTNTTTTLRLSALVVVNIIALVIALVFLCAAGFIYISREYGSIYACLAGAALFLVVALVVLAVHGEQKRRAEAKRAEAAKRASQSILTDPALLATGIQLARIIGVKRMLPVIALGGLALGLMAARRDSGADSSDDA
jgi:small-conductance mechanosensitive channel